MPYFRVACSGPHPERLYLSCPPAYDQPCLTQGRLRGKRAGVNPGLHMHYAGNPPQQVTSICSASACPSQHGAQSLPQGQSRWEGALRTPKPARFVRFYCSDVTATWMVSRLKEASSANHRDLGQLKGFTSISCTPWRSSGESSLPNEDRYGGRSVRFSKNRHPVKFKFW